MNRINPSLLPPRPSWRSGSLPSIALAVAAFIGSVAFATGDAEARLGQPLDRSSDWMRQFKVTLDSTGSPSTGAAINLGSPWKLYKNKLSVHVVTNTRGIVEKIVLNARRELIEKEWAFLNTMTADLLRKELPAEDTTAARLLANEIAYPKDQEVHFVGVAPETPEEPSTAYLAYLGQSAAGEQVLGRSVVRLSNSKVNGADWVRIELALKQ